MRIKNYLKYMMITACMMMLFLPLSLHASQTGTIQVDNQLQSDVGVIHVALYKVAEVKEGRLLTTQDFQQDPLVQADLESSSAQEKKAASYLDLIQRKQLTPTQTKDCDSQGKVEFQQVEEGIYLLQQYQDTKDSTFHSVPFFIQMPMQQSGGVNYQITTLPKNTIDHPVSRRISVVKQWKDNNDQYQKRPETISVGLYQEEALIQTVTLSALNNWSYEWTQVDPKGVYRVVELQVPSEYRMSVTQTQDQFTIVNQLVIHRDDITHGFVDVVTGNHGSIHSVITGDRTALTRYLWLFVASTGAIIAYVCYQKRQVK